MKERKHIEEELREISPFLADLKKENNFQIPDGYFEELNKAILLQTVEQEEQAVLQTIDKPKSRTNWLDNIINDTIAAIQSLWQPQYTMAFSIVALVLAAGWYVLIPNSTQELTADELEEYIEENIDQFDETLLVELASLEETEISPIDNLNLESQDLENYIDENIIDDLDETTLEELL